MHSVFNDIQQFDFAILNYIWLHWHTAWLDSLMISITTLGDSGFIWLIIGAYLLWNSAYRKTGVAIVLALGIGFLICNLGIKPLVGRLRPFEWDSAVQLLITAPQGYSFPSGHTWSSFAMATILMLERIPGRYIILGSAIIMGFSRIYLYVHYPTDVLVGTLLGVLIGGLSVYTCCWLFKTYSHHLPNWLQQPLGVERLDSFSINKNQ
ncbi:phosphatase PAP2 family protein [Veillonella intestinalis]|uniref:phosphatase PAP2 family protein n=1 Tax=Veillonella intestinalis TaxID=2941341 RepID=UPI002041BB18|nr:phosphatase PAP2 family protein [Veillonella intestinalis]